MITIEHHPEKPDKYLLILPAITLVIDEEEHQAIIDYGIPKIKLHPMSEEPERRSDYYHFYIIYEDGREEKCTRSKGDSKFCFYTSYGQYQYTWSELISSLSDCERIDGWLYESELSRLIKNNTAS